MKQLTRREPVRRDLDDVLAHSAAPARLLSNPATIERAGPAAYRPSTRDRLAGRGLEAVRELTLVAALFAVYELGRHVAADHVGRAFANAADVWHVERWLRLPDEATVQGPFADHGDLAHAANVFYASVHFPVTVAALVLLWCFRPEEYRWTRTVLAGLTLTSLLVHIGFPLAPPRLLPGDGVLDLGHLFGPSVYATTTTSGFADQFAAMPSLHVGWAMVVAIAGIRALRTRWRWLLLLHPLVTVLVVVVTGNHYWLDGLSAMVLLSVASSVVARRRGRSGAGAAAVASPG